MYATLTKIVLFIYIFVNNKYASSCILSKTIASLIRCAAPVTLSKHELDVLIKYTYLCCKWNTLLTKYVYLLTMFSKRSNPSLYSKKNKKTAHSWLIHFKYLKIMFDFSVKINDKHCSVQCCFSLHHIEKLFKLPSSVNTTNTWYK